MKKIVLTAILLFSIAGLTTSCKDAKLQFAQKKSSSKFKSSGPNPINTQSAGATSQTTGAGYKVTLKVSSMPINHTTASGYKFQGKVVIQ